MSIKLRQLTLLGGDLVLLYVSLMLALWLGFGWQIPAPVFSSHFFAFSLLHPVWLLIFYIFDFYALHSPAGGSGVNLKFHSRILGGLAAAFVAGIVFFYATPFVSITPKTNLFIDLLIFGALALGWRKLFFSIFSRRLRRRAGILKTTPEPHDLELELAARPHLGYETIPVRINDNIFNTLRVSGADTLIFTQAPEYNPRLARDLYRMLPARINFLDLARAYEIFCERIPLSSVDQLWFIKNLQGGGRDLYEKIKRMTDILFAGLIFITTLPLWLLIALAIKIEDRGPVFYLQNRVGRMGRIFSLIKFRSMLATAEAEGTAVWARENDPRITKVGRILRRFHLDEAPQMVNVLRGDISLVGPRPERPEFVERLEQDIPHYPIRHLIKPGFTGWAQIKFRYARSLEDTARKFEYDLYYIKNRSLLLDLSILAKTIQLLLFKND